MTQANQNKSTNQTRKTTQKKTNNERLNDVMERIRLTEEGKTVIDGKQYTAVAKRNEIFRKEFGFDVKIITDVLHMQDDVIVVKASIFLKDNQQWEEVAVGHAEENRNHSQMNRTSALENAETSALGRALANLGLSGGEFASSNEVSQSKNQSKPQQAKKMINKHQKQKIEQEITADESLKNEILTHYGVKDISNLTLTQANEVIKEFLPKTKQSKKSNENEEHDDDIQVM